jgi:L-lysine 6-transaminase
MYSEEYADFVEKFSEITPDFKHYFFIEGGALGVENALKAAFDWKAKKLKYTHSLDINNLDVIHLKNAFHGRTGYTLSLTNTTPEKTALFPKFRWTTVEPNWEDVERHVHRDVAAIIVEPIQGEGGDNHFPLVFFKNLRRIADENDCLLIFDEVQTGMGLTGKMWAYEHFDIVPDMMCFGKKTQVCGFCSTDRIDEVKDNVFNTSGRINSTWGGNIVDMVRLGYIVDAIQKEKLVDNAHHIGSHLLWCLRTISGLDNVRGRGLMIAFDLPSSELRDRMVELLQENMIVLKCGSRSIRLRPPLTFSEEDADTVCLYIREALEKL